MVKGIELPDSAEFCRWQSPRELRDLAVLTESYMSDEAFLSRGKEYEKTIQEALVSATFSLRFDSLVLPVSAIRMAKQNNQGWDFELKCSGGTGFEFEITTAYDEGRRIREDYRNGTRPDIPLAPGPAKPEWIAPFIRDKTGKKLRQEKNQGGRLYRHLLVYQNTLKRRGGTDLQQLRRLVLDSESAWQSIWLIVGVPDEVASGIALLYPSSDFHYPAGQWMG